MNSCCSPATNALQITLHKHVGCIPSVALQTGIPSKPDKPQRHRLTQTDETGPCATDWPRQQKAQAPQIGHGTPDSPKQSRLP